MENTLLVKTIKILILLLLLITIISCTALKKENIKHAKLCSKESTEEAIISCYEKAIAFRIRSKWGFSAQGLTHTDFPIRYKIEAEIKVDEFGNILDINLLSENYSPKLDRSIIRGIKRSSPLPVPKEPLFSKGGFSETSYTFVNYYQQ